MVTPSLNKSFKFQSDWPYNNSQVYLLGSIIDDLENDENKSMTIKDNQYIFNSKVNYPNNKKLVKQRIYIDKDYNITEVQVLDSDDNCQIKMVFSKIDLKAKFGNTYFNLEELINLESEEETESTSTIDDVIYPMYLPENTKLTNQETIDTETGQRLILTFDGDNPFMLIEETALTLEEHEIIPTSGDLEMLVDTVGVVNDDSINWVSNGIEYYVISDTLEVSELLEVARSISVLPVSK